MKVLGQSLVNFCFNFNLFAEIKPKSARTILKISAEILF